MMQLVLLVYNRCLEILQSISYVSLNITHNTRIVTDACVREHIIYTNTALMHSLIWIFVLYTIVYVCSIDRSFTHIHIQHHSSMYVAMIVHLRTYIYCTIRLCMHQWSFIYAHTYTAPFVYVCSNDRSFTHIHILHHSSMYAAMIVHLRTYIYCTIHLCMQQWSFIYAHTYTAQFVYCSVMPRTVITSNLCALMHLWTEERTVT